MSELAKGWAQAQLGNLCQEVPGSITLVRDTEYELYSVPAMASGSPEVAYGSAIGSAKRPVRSNDVLLCKINPRINRVWIVAKPDGRPQVASTEFIPLRLPVDMPVTARYLMWYLRSPEFRSWIKLNAEGATGSHTRAKSAQILRQLVPIAPAAEQERIVAAIEEQFSRIDAGAAALEKGRRHLKSMRAAALSDLFHDNEGRDWPEVDLGAVLSRGRYGTSVKCLTQGRGLPVLRIPNVQAGTIALDDLKYAADESIDLEGSLAADGDILIIRTNGSRSLIGRAAVVRDLQAPAAFASYLIQLRMNPLAIYPEYLVSALMAPGMRSRIEQLAATSAGQYNISLDKLRSLRIPLPPLDQQQIQLREVERIADLAARLEQACADNLTRSAKLRACVLAAAFSGQLAPQYPNDEPASALLERIRIDNIVRGDNGRGKAAQKRDRGK